MKNNSVNIAFIGDISLNNRYGLLNNNPFNTINRELEKSDFVVGNLEALLSGTEGFNLEKKPYLYADFQGFKLLNNLKLNLVSTAHNHVFDNFNSGYNLTREFLHEKNISVIGSSINDDNFRIPHIRTIKGLKFAFLNYCNTDTNFAKPQETAIKLNVYSPELIINDITLIKAQVDYVVLLLHWGGKTDYGFFPHINQIRDAESFIDAGADCIIGHHAHCIQPFERYKGKPVYYCLGNFCFDDIVSHEKTFAVRKSGKTGLAAIIRFDFKGQIKVSRVGIKNKNLNLNKSYFPLAKMAFLKPIFLIYKRSHFVQKLYFSYLKNIEALLYSLKSNNISLFGFLFNRISYKFKNLFQK